MSYIKYLQKIISFDDYRYSLTELFKIYFLFKIINLINDKFLLLIVINIVILYAPIESKCEHFLFKGKMVVLQIKEGLIGILSCLIPKYEEEEEKKINKSNK